MVKAGNELDAREETYGDCPYGVLAARLSATAHREPRAESDETDTFPAMSY
jgi:hypothetical protein